MGSMNNGAGSEQKMSNSKKSRAKQAAAIPGLDAHFRTIIEQGVRESRWFRTAPAELQATATIQILGIEDRKFYGFGTARVRPALVAECNCGGEVQKFSLLLDNTEAVEAIN